MKNQTPEQLLEQLEQQTNAEVFVQIVNEMFPGTFPTKSEMDLDHLELDINTFDKTDNP